MAYSPLKTLFLRIVFSNVSFYFSVTVNILIQDKHETLFVEIPFLFPIPLTDCVIFEIQLNLYKLSWLIGDNYWS